MAVHLFEGGDDFGFGPGSAAADGIGVDFRGAQGGVVASEMSDGGGVQAGIVALDGAAVERLLIGCTRAKLVDNRVAVPLTIARDFIGIETGGMERAVPFAEQAGLERCEGGAAEIIAAPGDGGPVQIVALAFGILDEADDQ